MDISEKELELIIFETMDLEKPVDVIYHNDNLWLSQRQIAFLFDKERTVITKHIKSILQTEELQADSVCAFFAHTAGDNKVYTTKYYNLDMIISVGYRVNSKRGTQFRIWASNVLKEYLWKGYTLNEKRLTTMNESLVQLKSSIALIERVISSESISRQEIYDLVKVITDYSRDLKLLDDYDNQAIDRYHIKLKEKCALTLDEVLLVIEQLKAIHRDRLFGLAKDNSLDSAINAIYQTFDGNELYPSLWEKAANLLYLLTKNHPFIDGNKRIAASIFLYFLNINGVLYHTDGSKLLSDGILAALTLLIAESNPTEKEMMVSIIMHYLQGYPLS